MEWIRLIIADPMFIALSETLLHFFWQGALISSFLFLFLKGTDVQHSQLRYFGSMLALILCAIAPVATFSVLYEPDVIPVIQSQAKSLTLIDAGELVSAGQASAWYLGDLLPFVSIVWMTGVVFLSFQLIAQLISVYKLPTTNTTEPDSELAETFERLMDKMGITLVTRLLVSSSVDVPMVIGWLRPVVLLPSAMVTGLTPKQLEMLLAHELAHVQRYDYLVNFLQTLVEVLLFFHPGVKWISRAVRVEREYCCDDIAIHHCKNPVAYASALTEAEITRSNNIPELAMAATGGDLKKRVFRAVGQTDCSRANPRHWLSGASAAGLSLMVVCLLLSAGHVVGMPHFGTKADKDKMVVVVQPKKPVEVEVKDQQVEESVLTHAAQESTDVSDVELAVESDSSPSIPEDATLEEIATEKELVDDVIEGGIDSKVADTSLTLPAEPQVEEDVVAAAPSLSQSQFSDSTEDSLETGLVLETAKQKVDEESTVSVANTSALNTSVEPELPSAESTEPTSAQPAEESSDSEIAAVTEAADALEQEIAEVEESTDTVDQIRLPVSKSKIENPVLVKSVTPYYPRFAIKRKLSGDVSVSFVVTDDGYVSDIEFNGNVHSSFRKSVSKALSKWRFEPATENGLPVDVKMTRIFSFTDPESASPPITGTRIAKL